MKGMSARTARVAVLVMAALVLAGCTSRTRSPAPVEDRSTGVRSAPLPPATAPAIEPAKPLPGSENAGKPGYYTVRPGDTLIRIGLESGQNWRDIVRWNNIDNPNVIEVGQVLRVAPPDSVVVRAVPPQSVAPAAAASQPAPAASSAASPAPAASTPRGTVTTAAPGPAGSQPPVPAEEEIAWGWPAPGNSSVVGSFDEVRNKGLDISGKAGDPVLAAADGRVVYAGAGLRGYGNLIILKHNNTYLTAYAHNQALLVKEDQAVRKGQKIAEMGSTDTDRVKLHFEIRRQGKPVDPARLLPPR